MRKSLRFLLLIFISIVILRLVGFTYAYYSVQINDNSNSTSISTISKYLKVEYLDGTSNMNFEGDYLFPGDSATKEFEVKNTGTGDLTYSLFLEDVYNDFERIQDLRYEIYINDELFTNGAINNNMTQYLYFDKELLVGQTDKIKFIFQYATTLESQNVDMNKTISFKFNIDTMKKNVFASTNGNVEFTNNNYQINGYRIYGNTGYNLPSAYQQVDYVQFQAGNTTTDNNAFIDTEVKATSETKAVIEYSFSSTNAQKVPFGVISANGDFYAGIGAGNEIIERYGSGGVTISEKTKNAGIKFKLELSKNGLYVDGKEILTNDASTFDTGLNIYLGAINNIGNFLSAYSAGWMKIYRFKLYESDTLVRDFIPCYRKNDNVAGMFDLVESKFYTSKNGNEIQVGNNVTAPTLDNTMKFVNVGDYDSSTEKYKIPVKISGKNILNKDTLIKNSSYFNWYDVLIKNTETGFKISGLGYAPIKLYDITELVEPGKTYYIHRDRIRQTEDGKDYKVSNSTSDAISGMIKVYVDGVDFELKPYKTSIYSNDVILTVPDSYNTIEIYTYGIPTSSHIEGYDETKTYTLEWKNVYLSEYPYESYCSYVEPITTDIYLEEPLRKVASYADYIDFEKQVIVRKIGQVNLTGVSDVYRTFTNNVRFGRMFGNIKPTLKGSMAVMSEFLPSGTSWSSDKETIFKHDGNYLQHFYVSFSKERLGIISGDSNNVMIQKATDFIKTIENNNVYYPLGEEEIIPINLSGLSLSSEYNIIQVNTAVVPSNVEINYYIK